MQDHPEFFRINREKSSDHIVSLLARHVLIKNADGVREVPQELIKTLLDVSINIHDKQRERADWWKIWIPIIPVLITVMATYSVKDRSANKNENTFQVNVVSKNDSLKLYLVPQR